MFRVRVGSSEAAALSPYVADDYVADDYVEAGGALSGAAFFGRVSADVAMVETSRPRTLAAGMRHLEQVYGWRLTIGSTVFGPQDIIPPLGFREVLGDGQALEVSFPIGDDLWRWLGMTRAPGPRSIGSFWATLGAPIRTLPVTFDWLYITPAGRKEVRLMTNGILTGASLESGASGRFVLLTIGDARARWDRRLVNFNLPVGHGRTRARIARELLVKAGVPSASIALSGSGTGLRKAVQISGSEGWSEVEDLMEIEGRALDVDRLGRVVSPLRVRVSGPVAMTLRETDLRADTATTASGVIDAPTRITLTAVAQRPVDETTCGLRTVDRVTETFGPYTVREAVQEQDAFGALANLPPGGAETDRLIERITNRQTLECDDLMREEIIEERWYNLETWRYELEETTGAINGYKQFAFLMEFGGTDDVLPVYAYRSDRFGLESRTVRQYVFGSTATGQPATSAQFHTRTIELQYGRVRTVTSVKERPTPTNTWESVNWNTNQRIYGNREGTSSGEVLAGMLSRGSLEEAGSSFGPTTQQAKITDYEIDERGYILTEHSLTYSWRIIPGNLHLYSDGRESNSAGRSWVVVEDEKIAYVERGDGLATKITARTIEGVRQPTVTEELDSYLPEAKRRSIRTPESADITDAETAEALEGTSPFAAELLRCEVVSALLEATRVRQERIEEVSGIENQGELCSLALLMLREGAAVEVELQPAAINWLIRRGDLIRVRDRGCGLDANVHVRALEVSDASPALGAAVQTITGAIYAE